MVRYIKLLLDSVHGIFMYLSRIYIDDKKSADSPKE